MGDELKKKVGDGEIPSGRWEMGHKIVGDGRWSTWCSPPGEVLTDYSWLQIHEHSSGNVFSRTSVAEERVEQVVTATNCLVAGHLAIRLDSVLQAVQLPAGVADLDSGLTDVKGDTLTLK